LRPINAFKRVNVETQMSYAVS